MIYFKGAKKSSELFSDLTLDEIKSSCTKGKIIAQIRNKRHEMKMSQEQFAKFLGVSQETLSKCENLDYDFTAEEAEQLLKALKERE